MKLDSYTDPGQEWEELELAPILEELLNDAYARGVLAENSVVYRDLFDTELMGRLTPRPALVTNLFQKLYEKSPREATDWYYKFSQDTNYIRRDRIAKDMQWKAPTEYGEYDHQWRCQAEAYYRLKSSWLLCKPPDRKARGSLLLNP